MKKKIGIKFTKDFSSKHFRKVATNGGNMKSVDKKEQNYKLKQNYYENKNFNFSTN